jgi:hypothetical protein
VAHEREVLCASLSEPFPGAPHHMQELAVEDIEVQEGPVDVYHASFAPFFRRAEWRNWSQ